MTMTEINKLENEQLSFFEFARTWDLEDEQIKERKSLAGIFYHAHQPVDFYEKKSFIVLLLEYLQLVDGEKRSNKFNST